jgi:hypothetical protein
MRLWPSIRISLISLKLRELTVSGYSGRIAPNGLKDHRLHEGENVGVVYDCPSRLPVVLAVCHKNEMRRLEFWAADRRFESAASLEFQWIKIRCFVEVIDVFDSFEPQGDSKCYWQ